MFEKHQVYFLLFVQVNVDWVIIYMESHWVLTPLPYFIIHSNKFHFVLSDEAIGPHCKHFFVLLLFKRYSEWEEITTSCEDFNLELSWFFDVVLQILIDSLLQLLQTWIMRHARIFCQCQKSIVASFDSIFFKRQIVLIWLLSFIFKLQLDFDVMMNDLRAKRKTNL